MIGRILYATGRHREAVEQMQTVIRINPEYARYMKQDPDLEPLRLEPEYRRIVGEE